MAHKRKLGELSKRAQELLKEIRGESVSSEMDKSKTKKAIQKNNQVVKYFCTKGRTLKVFG